MSLDDFNQECISELIEKKPPEPIKLKRHVSWFKEKVKKENDFKKRAKSTMGTAQELLPEPSNYLKKFSRTEIKKCTDEPHCLQTSVKKSQLPASQGKLKRESKDFIADNVKCVSSTNPKYSQRKVIDSHKGKSWPTTDPTFIYKKGYGISPKFKNQFNHPSTSLLEPQLKTSHQNAVHLMSKEERANIQLGLEKNLMQRNADFLLLPVIIDSPFLINQKKHLENDIKQIEKDLELITSNFEIFITDD